MDVDALGRNGGIWPSPPGAPYGRGDVAQADIVSIFGSNGFVCSAAAKPLISAAGFDQLLSPSKGGVCGVATQDPTTNLATEQVATTTAVAGSSKSAGALTAAPINASTTLAGGTDGATTITGSVLVGTDGLTRTGMYAWRGAGVSVGMLADCDDSTTWATQVAFGLAEGIYMVCTGPAGDTVGDGMLLVEFAPAEPQGEAEDVP